MKGFVTPAALFAVVIGYLSCEGLNLIVFDDANAHARSVALSESDDRSVDYSQYSGDAQDAELFDDSDMTGFDGDVFADVPEHMPSKGESQKLDEKGFGE
ncbi:hypothetical protein MO867_07025 [Microbulbifer sp. OS29]|uniref:Uncharacterized protein n=1 Tax=Microbulbifer okhotskensis TaxID=2926617 RepID=A0A9X2J4H0_9GAMM|nr:hypothetical protein [Microbulbifer okhotskensis]MCO1334093.1 hypothetical protein [Microbulbifer okhotskensis]